MSSSDPQTTFGQCVVGRGRQPLGLALVALFVALSAGGTADLHAQETATVHLPAPDVEWERQFSRVVSIRELTDGRVLLADRSERLLYLLDPESSEVRTIGSHGEGPGEYQTPGRLYSLRGDSTLFTDFTSRRWFVLEGEQIVETRGAGRALVDRFGPNLSGADDGGSVLALEGAAFRSTEGELGAGDRSTADSLRVLVGELDAEDERQPLVDTLDIALAGQGRWGARVTRSGRYVSVRRAPLATEDQAWLFSDGWIAIAFETPYRVTWRRPGGEWIEGPPIGHDPVEADRDELCFAIRQQGTTDCDLSVYPDGPPYVPPFLPGALLAGPDGALLVRRSLTRSDSVPRYDQFDRAGIRVRSIVLENGEAIVGTGPSGVYVVATDDLGLQTLRRVPWPEGG